MYKYNFSSLIVEPGSDNSDVSDSEVIKTLNGLDPSKDNYDIVYKSRPRQKAVGDVTIPNVVIPDVTKMIESKHSPDSGDTRDTDYGLASVLSETCSDTTESHYTDSHYTESYSTPDATPREQITLILKKPIDHTPISEVPPNTPLESNSSSPQTSPQIQKKNPKTYNVDPFSIRAKPQPKKKRAYTKPVQPRYVPRTTIQDNLPIVARLSSKGNYIKTACYITSKRSASYVDDRLYRYLSSLKSQHIEACLAGTTQEESDNIIKYYKTSFNKNDFFFQTHKFVKNKPPKSFCKCTKRGNPIRISQCQGYLVEAYIKIMPYNFPSKLNKPRAGLNIKMLSIVVK